MKIKIKNIIYILLFTFFLNIDYLKSKEMNLDNKYIPLKDFVILKFDLFLRDNVSSIFKGGGMWNVAYQEIKYDVKITNEKKIKISIKGIMDKNRYKSKRYYPKLSDCNQIRNKIFVKKYGYSFFTQKLNNLVNEENISNIVNNEILNISSLNENLKDKILNNTNINIEVVHPKKEKNIICSGKLINPELEISK
tara:strand:+ start:130 stop:711 length:582 start_codon:yes stop_codon:yes gene_type:complete